MKVLFISKLEGQNWQGPSYSVPRQILAQSKVDDVLWVNINGVAIDNWLNRTYFRVSDKNNRISLNDIEKPFDRPDVVVFEGVYEYPFCRLVFELVRFGIPYVVIPRSALTCQAQHQKWLKKRIANFLYFNMFLKNASAVQYLTREEFQSSSQKKKWSNHGMIIPNGIDRNAADTVRNNRDSSEKIIVVYIGRLDMYQKGLDLVIRALAIIKNNTDKVVLHCYGPDYNNTLTRMKALISDNDLGDMVKIHGPVFFEEKLKILNNSDVFIMASRFEGLPMGLIEALSLGLPCIVTKGTNMADEICEYGAGWSADNDSESIANAILRMISQKEKFIGIQKNALNLAEKYNWDEIAKITHEYYADIVKGKTEKEYI